MTLDISRHPCFNKDMHHKTGRIHLPVAPRCNVQCNFCSRKFDCVNESRPGVTSKVLEPKQAIYYLDKMMEKLPNISVVGIAGPGDPFANPDETMETFRLIRQKYPDMLLCVATNGLNLYPYIDELAQLKISHVTVTINAVDPEIVSKVYSWIRYEKRVRKGLEAAEILLENQLKSIKKLKELNIIVKVNIVTIPGVNDSHVEEIVKTVSAFGVDICNCMAIMPTAGTKFEDVKQPTAAEMNEIRKSVEKYVPQMTHCARCRADAAGLIGQNNDKLIESVLAESSCQTSEDNSIPVFDGDASEKPYLAVASMEGVLVNQHLGEAMKMLIVENDGGEIMVKEERDLPLRGTSDRWRKLAELLSDCKAILVNGAGEKPIQEIGAMGIKVLVVEGLISEIATAVFDNSVVKQYVKRKETVCGQECQGTGMGCG